MKMNINPDVLKIGALVTMTLDHFAWVFIPESDPAYLWLRVIGRTAFPVFAFLMMLHLFEHSESSRIFKKYVSRLFLFGSFSFIVLKMFGHALPLNILFSFLIVVLFIGIVELLPKQIKNKVIYRGIVGYSFVLFAFFSLICDYHILGFLFVLFYYARFKYGDRYPVWKMPVLLISPLIGGMLSVTGGIVSFLTVLFLFNIDFKKQYKRLIPLKWLFYFYYPLHLLFLFSIRYLLLGN